MPSSTTRSAPAAASASSGLTCSTAAQQRVGPRGRQQLTAGGRSGVGEGGGAALEAAAASTQLCTCMLVQKCSAVPLHRRARRDGRRKAGVVARGACHARPATSAQAQPNDTATCRTAGGAQHAGAAAAPLAFDRSMTGRPLPLGTTCSRRVDTALHSTASAAQTCEEGSSAGRGLPCEGRQGSTAHGVTVQRACGELQEAQAPAGSRSVNSDALCSSGGLAAAMG